MRAIREELKRLEVFMRARWNRKLAVVLLLPAFLISSSFLSHSIKPATSTVEMSKLENQHQSDFESTRESDKAVSSSIHVSSEKDSEPVWLTQGRMLARAFTPWAAKDPYGWCVNKPRGATGLLFIKIQKCASSTGSGITLNIAHNVALRRGQDQCPTSVRHYRTQKLPIPTRNPAKSLLWTIVRHPAKRALSSYFFYEVSQAGKKPTDKAMRRYLKRQRNFQADSLRSSSLANYTMMDIVDEMDFIAVSERMDESLVVFRLLNGFKRKDMIVLSSKQHGGYDGGMNGKCHKIVPSFTTPAIQEYLSTTFEENNDDYVLYSAANASLDRTIDLLGRKRVQKEVQRHHFIQKMANKHCQESAHFPCSDNGKHQLKRSRSSCYERDWGCGYQCVYDTLK